MMHTDVRSRIVSAVCLTLMLAACAFGQRMKPTKPGQSFTPELGEWTYTTVIPKSWEGELKAILTLSAGSADLYVRKGSAPTTTQYDYRVIGAGSTKTITVGNTTSPTPLTNDTWYIGVYQYPSSVYSLSAAANRVKTVFDIKGASRWSNGASSGTSFKTWAPFASSVNIAGVFNSWSTTQVPLVSEGDGWWSIDYRGVTNGQEYKYVIKNGASTIWKADPWARRMVSSIGNSIVYDQSTFNWTAGVFQTPSFNDMVIYEMHIGTYNDTSGGLPGTFLTAINKLDHLQNLGVNCVELMPVQEFPGDFSWGYNMSYPFSVESAYGGPENLKKFVDEANKRGIAVLLDVIHNHYGPNDLDMWRYDGWYQGSYGGVFFYNDGRAVTPWGNTRPDYGRSEVRQYIRDNQMMWANDFRISGFRWDSTLNMRVTNSGDNADGWSLLQYLNNELDTYAPWKINIAEDLQNNSWLTRTTSLGGAGFDSQWSNFVHTVRSALTTGDDNARDMNAVAGAVGEYFNGDAFERVIYTESHDEDANGKKRVPSEIDSGSPGSYWAQKRSTLGAALVFTSPGIPMLFQGQEMLEDGWFADTDPIDWSKTTTYSGIVQMYHDLISLRRNLTGRTAGLKGNNLDIFHNNNTNKVMAFHRWMNGGTNDDVVVVANFRNQTWTNYRIGFPRIGNWSVVFNSDWNGYSSLFGNLNCPNVTAGAPSWDGLGQSATVNLAPYSVVIFAKD